MTINDIRKSYLEYFQSKDHQVMPSSSLLPAQDPTLLFTTAGMVPFKDYFSGERVPPSPRLVSVQKCLRTTDLESVGKTKRHMSFFEMLGNFSFGNYFKKEAIEFAWEYSTQVLPFPANKIWISIFENDDEAHEIWTKYMGIPANRIVRLGRADNFWGPAGEAGACGPCSELYLDRGEQFGTGPENLAPGGSGDRFMEFWNLVFNQFDFQRGEYLPLKMTGIDTGAGLERLATLVQNVDSVFDTNELKHLREKVSEVYGKSYTGENIIPIRVLTDHIRTLCFAMSDGIFPSNESRGYVLRRVLRRALLFGRKLGQKSSVLHKVADTVFSVYGDFYPELRANGALIQNYILQEENRFLKTLDDGSSRLEEIIDKAKNDIKAGGKISGRDAFILYDTFGFPLEMTAEIAEQMNLSVDVESFEEEMEKQRSRGRAAWKGGLSLPLDRKLQTEFTGHSQINENAIVTAICTPEVSVTEANESLAESSNPLFMVTDKSPFYAEGGGQLGDTGIALFEGGQVIIGDTRKYGEAFVHIISKIEGTLRVGDVVHLKVDTERRFSLARHHSATHLLNAALRQKFGNHIKQSGSLVHYDYLRFDFTHPQALTEIEIQEIQSQVNQVVKRAETVHTEVLPIAQAEKRGAIMTFGEKYGDIVRVVEMGEYSKEFCGGTHVKNTSEIGSFLILKESSPGAGNRRIEAVSDKAAYQFLKKKLAEAWEKLNSLKVIGNQNDEEFSTIEKSLQLTESLIRKNNLECWELLRTLLKNIPELEKKWKKKEKIQDSENAFSTDTLKEYLKKTENLGKLAYCEIHIPDADIPALKSLADNLREIQKSVIYVLKGSKEDKFTLVMATSQAYAKENGLNLAELLKSLISQKIILASGGGKAELVQATGNGNLPEKLVVLISPLVG